MAEPLHIVNTPAVVSTATITQREAAARSGFSYTTWCRAVRTGQVPASIVLRLGPRTVRISADGLDRWLRGDS